MSFSKPVLATILAAAIIAGAGHAAADDAQRIRSVRVAYDDLDLDREADAREMLARLERAAHEACGRYPERHSSYRIMPERTKAAFQECRRRAVAAAVQELNAARLNELHARSAG
ncbi:UrcA family protein [Amphiplicatus metriothermophilus]|uniref:UrcA family protein n=1 Tax=Amphiplicatus metriothermophilus TaxID=1519374 RepID=A0A239PQX6_9PROT|nr:UrcA family protein [Amphiplicatus metriothermophilus]MBB5518716.1 UrcA family protein [Amphiplicatus metriothermophilus]SNT72127.1 UrcA family protein [Amphiplicatus metriothermophilus]